MRCRHCNAPLIPVPFGGDYTAACSCGAGYLVQLTERFQPTKEPARVQAVREYMLPGSY